MSFTISASALLFLTLCCGTGSLLTVIPTLQTGVASRPVRIECHYGVCQGVSWSGPVLDRNERPARYTVTVTERTSVLTIDPLMEEDEGDYFCTCNNGRSSGPSDLIVHRKPNVDEVNLNQTFHRGETVAVECNADPGDPPRVMIWVRNNNKVLPGAARMRIDAARKALIIEAINDSDAGLYQCVFQSTSTPIRANINVNVIDPPQMLEPVFNPDLPRSINISYGEPLNLDCRNPVADSSVVFTWILDNDASRIENHLLMVAAADVTSGAYRCLAYRNVGPGNEFQHTVLVTLVDTPPILVRQEARMKDAIEQEDYSLRLDFKFRLDMSNVTVEWFKNGETANSDFDSRLTFTISQTVLRFHINDAKLSDRGQYSVNIGNQFGNAQLQVTVDVRELINTVLQVQITDIDCDSVEEQGIARQIANQCSTCGNVRVGSVEHRCDDQDTITLTITLRSQDTVRISNQVSLHVESSRVSAQVCPGADCFRPTTSEVPPPDPEASLLVVSVVVAGILIVIVLVVMLVLTILIKKTYFCCKHKVGQEDGALEHPQQVVIVQQDPAPDCIGYARVATQSPPIPSSADPTVTPVTLPREPPPPHITPFLPHSGSVASSAAKPPPLTTTRAKRPERLYFRSHSYHGSTRTPQA